MRNARSPVPSSTESDVRARLAEAEAKIAELETTRLRTETLLAITQVLSKTLTIEDTFAAILDELQRVVPYDSCSIQVIQGNRLAIVAGRGFDDLGGLLGVGFDLDDETNPGIQVVRSKRRQVFADVSHHPHFASELHGGGRIRGWICAPMIIGDRVIGVLSVDKFDADFYDEELADLATAFAAEAATAIENARLLETERIAREQAETLRAAAESLGSALDLPEVIDLILGELRRVVPYRAATIQRLEGFEMMIVGSHGFPNPDELLGLRFDWRGPDGPARELVERLEPVIVADVSARFEHFNEEAHGGGRVKSFMGVPMLVGDRLIGMLTADSLEVGFYTAEHASVAKAFATFAATAVERARLFREVAEAEQRHRDLVENMPAAMYLEIAGKDGFSYPEYVSPQTGHIFGYPLERWSEPGFQESLIHPADRPSILAGYADAYARGDERFSASTGWCAATVARSGSGTRALRSRMNVDSDASRDSCRTSPSACSPRRRYSGRSSTSSRSSTSARSRSSRWIATSWFLAGTRRGSPVRLRARRSDRTADRCPRGARRPGLRGRSHHERGDPARSGPPALAPADEGRPHGGGGDRCRPADRRR